MSTNPDILLTIPEAQAALKVSRGFLYILRDRGALEFVNLGRAARIRQSSIDRLISSGAAASLPADGGTEPSDDETKIRAICTQAVAALIAWRDAARSKDPDRMNAARSMRDSALKAAGVADR